MVALVLMNNLLNTVIRLRFVGNLPRVSDRVFTGFDKVVPESEEPVKFHEGAKPKRTSKWLGVLIRSDLDSLGGHKSH